jgi:hypothetical protein
MPYPVDKQKTLVPLTIDLKLLIGFKKTEGEGRVALIFLILLLKAT